MPSSVVTVVSTDVVDLARLRQQAPENMEKALARHDEIIGRAVAAHAGVVLKPRLDDDSTVSVFGRATDALRAAHAAQQAFASEPWPTDATITVRIAVHAGEPAQRGGDLLGAVVNEAARLRAAANGGEIVTSGVVAELVRNDVPAGTRLAVAEAGPDSTFVLQQQRAEPEPSPPSLLEERGVTRREAEVLEALGDRLTNAEIAARLYVSYRTVESHVSSLLRKLRVDSRLDLSVLAKELSGSARLGAPELPAALELLADPVGYVGRVDERGRLRELWRRATTGQMLVALVTGEAGIGKSRLVAELAAEVYGDGGRVLLGSCFEDVQLPYQPFVQAISDDLATLPDSEVRRRVGAAAALVRMLPELASRLGVSVGPDVVDAAGERAEVFAAIHGYLSRAAGAAPLLLVIEDLHWATTTTHDALRHLARVGGHAPALLVATCRDTAPDLDESLAVFLTDLAQLPAVEQLSLTGLEVHEVGTLLGTIGARGDPETVAAETGGNPLFVREVASGSRAGAGGSLPALLARRYARLDRQDVATLDMASVLGSEFDADLLAACADAGLSDVLESLERAEAAGLVAASPGRPGRFSFLHALFRAARYDSIPASRRLQLHRQVVWALEPRSEDDRVIPELARHACIAAPLGDARAALDYARRAGDLAERALALDEAAVHYRRALDVADLLDPPDLRTRLRLSIRLGELLNGAGDPEHRRVLLDAAAIARDLDDAHALADIAWALVHFGFTLTAGTSDPEFVDIAEAALAGLGPEPTAARARTLAALSADLSVGGDPMRAFDLAQEALAIARCLDDPITLAHVLLAYRFSARTPSNVEARHPAADQLVAIGRRTGRPILTIIGLHHRAWSFREQGDLAACDESFAAVEAMLGQQTMPPSVTSAAYLAFKAARQVLTGDLAAAEATAEGVLALSSARGFDPLNWYGPAIMMIRHMQGRSAELISLVEAAARQPGIDDVYTAGLSVACAHGGRLDDARAIVRRFADQQFSGIRPNLFWLTAMVLLCEAAELTADADAAEQLAAHLSEFSGLIADLPPAVVAPVDLALAQAALTSGDNEQAEALATKAADASRRRRTPIFLGRELVRLAEARRRRGASAADVRPLVDEALKLADQTGAGLIRQESDRYGLQPTRTLGR